MNKFVAVYTACSLLVLLMAGQAAQLSSDEDQSAAAGSSASSAASSFNNLNSEEEIEEELESEMELKKMLMYVTPLMGIFQKHKQKYGSAFKRSVDYELDDHENAEELDTSSMVEEGRKRGRRPPLAYQKTSPDRSGYYGDYAAASSGYGGGGGCCDKKDDLLPILALTALSLLLLYLIAIATTTTTTGKRRRRSSDDNDLIEEYDEIEVIDAPTWLTMVDQLWNGESEDESGDACTLKALCRMNHLAIEAAGSTGMAVSLSSLPLSYLLHHRHQGGFFSYLDASLMGRSGENCTTLFSSCQRVI